MLKNIAALKETYEGKDHLYMCDNDTPLDHVEEVLLRYLTYVRQIKQSALAQQEKMKAETDQQTAVVEEVAQEQKAE